MSIILLILALACFVCAAFGVSPARVELLPAGLAFWVLAQIVTAWP